jgi:hypothetical protein
VQTALEHGDGPVKSRLWDIIIPLIPGLRSTPCGRRLVQKLQQRDAEEGTQAADQFTPESATTPAATPHRQSSGHTFANFSPPAAPTYGGSAYVSQIASPQPHRLSNASQLQASVGHPYSPYNRVHGHTNGQVFGTPGQVNGQTFGTPGGVNGQAFGGQGQVNGQSYGSPQHAIDEVESFF